MAAPSHEFAFDLEVARAAAERYEKREAHHERFEQAAANRRYSELDTPERLAKRANRLLSKLQAAAPEASEAMVAEFDKSMAGEIRAAEVSATAINDELLERVIGETRDFLFVAFLEQAVFACKAVARIVTNLGASGRVSFGTGFMVSPTLLLTNHHVLPSADAAARSSAEFDFQRDRFGRDVLVRSFRLDPGTFFLNDKDLDFALVAVTEGGAGRPLRDYGWCPLLKEEGKIVVGEAINIIQHPKGERKQVIIRENRLIDLPDPFAHYEADTEPGSSGSPVFNNQWEVIALHHAGVPKRNAKGEFLGKDDQVWRPGDDPLRLAWIANEGIRVSRLIGFISKASVRDSETPLLKQLLDAKPAAEDGPSLGLLKPQPEARTPRGASMRDIVKVTAGQSVTLTVPLQITLTLGAPRSDALRSDALRSDALRADEDRDVEADGSDDALHALQEAVVPDPSDPGYKNRPGYKANFLGFDVPFPKLTNVTRPSAFALPGLSGDRRFELKYHHFSVILNKERKLAFVAGVNFDPTAPFKHPRENDKWFFDPRVGTNGNFQAGENLYAGNPLDRGHLVRRADAGWGKTKKEAKLANDDTFHFTNCSPQHAITNQGQLTQAPPGLKLWGKLEDHVAAQGKENHLKLCVFNGPVFRSSDDPYRGVKLPKEFWKVVVCKNDAGKPTALAFVLTQAELIQGLEEEFEAGQYQTVQVRIRDLEAKTRLDFGPFRDWDALEGDGAVESFSSDVPAVVLESVNDIVL